MKRSIVTTIIVTYNSENEIVGCLDSIFKNRVDAIVYVVDNNSSDGTQRILKEYARKEAKVKLILNSDNRGLAAGNNQPIEFIDSKYTLILNPDIILRDDSIEKMIDGMEEDDRIGMLGPLSVFEDGTPHSSAHKYYNIWTILLWRTFPYSLLRRLVDAFSSFTKRDVLFVSGACYLIPSGLYKAINGYDEKLFLTVSDVADIGVRIRSLGYKAIFYPKAVITHFSGRSNAPLKFLTQFWGLSGDLHFLHKHYGQVQYLTAKKIFVLSSLFRGALFKFLSLFSQNKELENKVKLYFDLAKALKVFKV